LELSLVKQISEETVSPQEPAQGALVTDLLTKVSKPKDACEFTRKMMKMHLPGRGKGRCKGTVESLGGRALSGSRWEHRFLRSGGQLRKHNRGWWFLTAHLVLGSDPLPPVLSPRNGTFALGCRNLVQKWELCLQR
jgi:hypothetical protein